MKNFLKSKKSIFVWLIFLIFCIFFIFILNYLIYVNIREAIFSDKFVPPINEKKNIDIKELEKGVTAPNDGPAISDEIEKSISAPDNKNMNENNNVSSDIIKSLSAPDPDR